MAYEEGEQLTAELGRLKQELSFVVAPTYSQWTGPADQHLYLKGRDLKRAVMDAAKRFGAEAGEHGFGGVQVVEIG